MNFRTDSWMWADIKVGPEPITHEQAVEWYGEEEAAAYDATPPAVQGDVWRIRWHKEDLEGDTTGPLAGYALVCPGCNRVHAWTSANNCQPRVRTDCGKNDKGETIWADICLHSGKGSCWNWTGSAEEGTLSATPSLLNHMCGWHGFLTNGVMKGC